MSASTTQAGNNKLQDETRWLYCVECPQYSTRIEALGYLFDCKWAFPKITSGQSNLP